MNKPRQIRILHVFAQMGRGGSETMIMNYYRHIDRSQIQFDFVVHTTEKCDYDDEIKELGGKLYRIPRFTGYNYFSYQKAWYQFLKKHPDYKIIHIHFYTIAGAILPVAKKCDVPVRIVHSHTANPKLSIVQKIVGKILRCMAIKYATERFACGNDAGKYFFGKRSFTIINNAIDAELFRFNQVGRNRLRKQLNIENKFVIGHIGRFHTPKNHTFIIDVFAEVCRLNCNAMLLLVGDGALRAEIERKVVKAGLSDRVIFAGVRTDIPQLLQAMDIFLFPSLYEGLGIVAVEAQAAGLRAIVSDSLPKEAVVTELSESISLKIGAKVWAEVILKYDNHYQHPDTFNEICCAGYDIKNNAARLGSYYLNMCKPR